MSKLGVLSFSTTKTNWFRFKYIFCSRTFVNAKTGEQALFNRDSYSQMQKQTKSSAIFVNTWVSDIIQEFEGQQKPNQKMAT